MLNAEIAKVDALIIFRQKLAQLKAMRIGAHLILKEPHFIYQLTIRTSLQVFKSFSPLKTNRLRCVII